ncbi:MAG: NAD(P)/FAD-dependent oxidoreductase [Akkermansiaceae bacterium]|nr:NAD(P)/FAD-dependent oxidoreductase [Armatimonadota bacterium]
MATKENGHVPRVVIIGGGFAGLEAAKVLGNKPVEVILLDRTNHHLFQPLLYQVATAALAPTDIATPIRHILRNYKNVSVMLAEVKEIDPDRKVVIFDEDRDELPFDYLLLATGTRHGYFKNPEWEQLAPGLKTINDAMEIRQRFLMAFEEAEKREIDRDEKERTARDSGEQPPLSFEQRRASAEARQAEADRDAFLTFVIVGAGPTGCELSGTIPEVACKAMNNDFRRIDTRAVRMILIEAGSRILPQFPEDLAAKAQRDLEKLGVEIMTGDPVVRLEDDCVYLKSGTTIATKTVIWAAGNVASPLAKNLTDQLDKAGRVKVEKDLSVPGHPEIFVAGDLMYFDMGDDKPVPGVAQGAIQSGAIAGQNILHRLYGEGTVPFSYWDKGNLAVIGRGKAIADLHFAKVSGFIAWCIWLFIHILYLVGFRNRLSVLIQWSYSYLFFQRGARLIQPEGAQERMLAPAAAKPKESNPGAQETRQVWQ